MLRSRFRLYALLALMLTVAAIAASPLLGQGSAGADSSSTSVGAALATTSASDSAPIAPATRALVGPRVPADRWTRAGVPEFVLPQDDISVGPNLALMGVGGAALVIGLLIGGDTGTVVAAAGGVVGLVGLYRFLR